MRTSWLLISSLELNFSVTSLKIITCGVVLSTSWIPRFNKVVDSQNGSHDLVLASLLDSDQIIQVMFLWSSAQILAISPHNFMWYLIIPSAQSSLFIPRNNLLPYEMNLIPIFFSTLFLLLIMLWLLYINNGSLLTNWKRDNACRFALLKLFCRIPIPIILKPLYHMQLIPSWYFNSWSWYC